MNHFAIIKESQLLPLEEQTRGPLYVHIEHQGHYYRVVRLEDPEDVHIALALFDDHTQQCLESCHDFYRPALVLAGLDVQKRHYSKTDLRDFSVDGLMRDFKQAVRFYLEEQKKKPFMMVEISSCSDDLDLPSNAWVWLLGYYNEETTIWEGPRAVVINIYGCRNFMKPKYLNISQRDLEERFPDTPVYWIDPYTPPDFCPPSLSPH